MPGACRAVGQVEGEGGLPYAGAGGEYVKGASAQSASEVSVDLREARGQGVRPAFVHGEELSQGVFCGGRACDVAGAAFARLGERRRQFLGYGGGGFVIVQAVGSAEQGGLQVALFAGLDDGGEIIVGANALVAFRDGANFGL